LLQQTICPSSSRLWCIPANRIVVHGGLSTGQPGIPISAHDAATMEIRLALNLTLRRATVMTTAAELYQVYRPR
jgi:hypothetical protein